MENEIKQQTIFIGLFGCDFQKNTGKKCNVKNVYAFQLR